MHAVVNGVQQGAEEVGGDRVVARSCSWGPHHGHAVCNPKDAGQTFPEFVDGILRSGLIL